MNQQQLYDFLNSLGPKIVAGKQAWSRLEGMINTVKRRVATDDPLISPLTAAELTHIINYYQPLYQQAKDLIEAAGDAIGTDN